MNRLIVFDENLIGSNEFSMQHGLALLTRLSDLEFPGMLLRQLYLMLGNLRLRPFFHCVY